MTEDTTDINWKARAAGVLTWMKLHPETVRRIACFVAGVVVGVLL